MEVTNLAPAVNNVPEQRQSNLDRDAFLKILVAQLKNQDPLSPLEDKDFIAQVAQFSLLEEVKTLGESFDQTKAMGYLGKNVIVPGGDHVFNGRVDSISISGNKMFLHVGEHVFSADDVTGVIYEDQ